ncbi:histidine kinase [bacterium]|nr:histidine kinase [bacterium]
MEEGINLSHRLLRMRARPKILLATDFEEAWSYFERYKNSLLGVISDGRFPWAGESIENAGVSFIQQVKAADPHMPAVLQSTNLNLRGDAEAAGAGFIHKHSPHLLRDLQEFMAVNFGFGDFVFRMSDGREIARARDLRELVDALRRIPDESLVHHASKDHFSNWLRARTEFALAAIVRPRKPEEFDSVDHIRTWLIDCLERFRTESQRGVVADFHREHFDASNDFTRIGGGSLGGKARGLAFMNSILNRYNVIDRFEGVIVDVPPTAVVATDVYDQFLDENDLRARAISGDLDDAEICQLFLAAKLPGEAVADLCAFIEAVDYPLAVRSSSLLEDSQFQPFAGVYATYMLPNGHEDPGVRLDQLCDAIKLVYASVFQRGARAYLHASGSRIEEEKMAVVIQQVVGRQHEHYVYPDFAGVGHSTDFYPAEGSEPQEGVVCAALGMGSVVVEGGKSLRFNPRRPRRLKQFGTLDDWLEASQRMFKAIDLSRPEAYPQTSESYSVTELELSDAERHGTLAPVGSTFSPENQAIYDGVSRPGPRIVSFAHVLKAGVFPLAEIMTFLLDLGRNCMSAPVEIEWAVALSDRPDQPHQFGFLQIRPLATTAATVSLSEEDLAADHALVTTGAALGNGHYDDIRDVVYVPPSRFDRGATVAAAAEVAEYNGRLDREGLPYLLLGPGRWGSADRWLGIPVRWDQIAAARVIVETDLPDFKVTPSEGTHFFQNLTSFQVGYFTVNHGRDHHACRWELLDALPAVSEGTYVRHVRLDAPLDVRIDGTSRRGLVRLP